jgi:hypothetical protein
MESGSSPVAHHADHAMPALHLALDDLGHHPRAEQLVDGRVPEEVGHVDRERVEQARELVGIVLEVARVLAVSVQVQRAQSRRDPPLDVGATILGEIDAALGRDRGPQPLHVSPVHLFRTGVLQRVPPSARETDGGAAVWPARGVAWGSNPKFTPTTAGARIQMPFDRQRTPCTGTHSSRASSRRSP